MERISNTGNPRDILASPWPSFLVFWLPGIAIVVVGNSGFSSIWRTIVWTAALAIMGAACIANARRCGRLHCYFTGPFFLAMAVVTLLFGLGLFPLGRNGWNLLGLIILIGAIGLCCVPEMLLGRYRKGRAADGNRC